MATLCDPTVENCPDTIANSTASTPTTTSAPVTTPAVVKAEGKSALSLWLELGLWAGQITSGVYVLFYWVVNKKPSPSVKSMTNLAITQLVFGGITFIEWLLFFLKVLNTQSYVSYLVLASPWILFLEGAVAGVLTFYAYADGGLRDYVTLVLNVIVDLYAISIGLLQFFITQDATKNAEDSVTYLPKPSDDKKPLKPCPFNDPFCTAALL